MHTADTGRTKAVGLVVVIIVGALDMAARLAASHAHVNYEIGGPCEWKCPRAAQAPTDRNAVTVSRPSRGSAESAAPGAIAPLWRLLLR